MRPQPPAVTVHPTAVVQGRVRLAPGCAVGPLAVLRGPVTLGAGTSVDALAVIAGPATFGERNRIHPFAVLGGPPQDRTYAGEPTRLVVGSGNVFREHVTVHRGTRKGGGTTRIGEGCLFMAGVHVAHDCRIGDGVQIANSVSLGGHVVVEAHAVIGGHAAIAPFVRVGHGSMIAGGAMVDRDVPPDCIVRGDRAAVVSLNVVGLRRRGASVRSIDALRAAFTLLFRDGCPFSEAMRACAPLALRDRRVRRLVAFLRTSRVGVRRTGRGAT